MLWSQKLANWHFWLGLLGMMFYVIPMYWAGITQGLMWKQFTSEGFMQYLPIGLVIGGIFMFELLMVVGAWVINPTVTKNITAAIPANVSNTEALGLVLYTRYIHYFQLAGMVLLVAMIGAILLTLRHRKDVKRQNVLQQMWRDPAKAMELKDVKPDVLIAMNPAALKVNVDQLREGGLIIADTGEGAAGCASGSQTCTGTRPALAPKPSSASRNGSAMPCSPSRPPS